MTTTRSAIATLALAAGLVLSAGVAHASTPAKPLPAPSSSNLVAVCQHTTGVPGYARVFVRVTSIATGTWRPGRYDIVPAFDHETGPDAPAVLYFGHRWDWEYLNGRWVHGPAQRLWFAGCQ